ncbi:MAG TPA: acyltransferase, partial [Candidatus Methylacidiphilales bacterium]
MARAADQHIPRLDVLRAAAFLMVLSVHFCQANDWWVPRKGNLPDFSHQPLWTVPLVPFTWGMYGVALFFVISGYCIHLSYLRAPSKFEWKGFFWRRFLRLYPAYLVSLVVCVMLQRFRHHAGDWSIWQIPTHLLFIHNLFNRDLFYGINGVYWSLGVEFQFYALYPLLLLGREKWGMDRCLILSLGLNLLCQIGMTFYPYEWTSEGRSAVMTWCDWILGACLVEAHLQGHPLFRNSRLAIGLSLAMFLVALYWSSALSSQTYLFASVFFAALVDRYLLAAATLSKLEKVLVPVGVVSYSLYLWHPPLIYFTHDLLIRAGLPPTPLLFVFIYLPVNLLLLGAVATASW